MREWYRVGQLYTISKHSHQESDKGEGVEVVKNEPHEDPVHGCGQFTEKRVHLSSQETARQCFEGDLLAGLGREMLLAVQDSQNGFWRQLPTLHSHDFSSCQPLCWACSSEHRSQMALLVPFLFASAGLPEEAKLVSVTALAVRCSFLPKFSIYIETKYEDNCGDNANIFHGEKILGDHEVTFLDIAFDEIPERYYRSIEDLRYFSSSKTGRGPLQEGWRERTKPIMCSYKLVMVKFEVWGLQTRVEQFVHKVIRDILLIGHRQAFAWVDEWCDMSLEEVRAFETQMYAATNINFRSQEP
ncbi:hypothetical protein lerEdw1_018464 [Lerista edwardsae]|nr:hypothetical protein lerEdw1_018464 [Lerista edwardsae]